jgi:hypothetical protein
MIRSWLLSDLTFAPSARGSGPLHSDLRGGLLDIPQIVRGEPDSLENSTS